MTSAMTHTVHPQLARAIDESFGTFLRREAFRFAPNDVTGPFANRVAVYDGPEYRLVFEFDRTNDFTVVARALNDRLRGGALGFLLLFLTGNYGSIPSFQAQAETLQKCHGEIADLLTGRDQARYAAFVAWIEVNWNYLTTQNS